MAFIYSLFFIHMITFITDSSRHQVTYNTVNSEEGRRLILSSLENTDVVSLDYETNGLDPYKNQLLLTALKIGEDIYVWDNTSVDNHQLACVFNEQLFSRLVLAHHAKFEYRFSKVNGLILENLYCTMVAEQRLIMGTGYSASIVETCKRRGVELPVGMDKDIRDSFIGADVNSVVFTDEQILYAASDVIPLEDIKKAQEVFIDKYNMQHLIYNIEMPLISILGFSELDGFAHDSPKWISYAKKEEKKAIELTKQLDSAAIEYGVNLAEINPEIIKRTSSRINKIAKLKEREEKLFDKKQSFVIKDKTHLKAYSITCEQYWKVQIDLKELLELADSEEEYIGINWSSSDQVIKVFQSIKGFPIPMDKNKDTKQMQSSVGKEARSLWFSEYSNTEYNSFFSLFDSYKKTIHNVNAFGEEWVRKYVHPITGRVHTTYKQCNTDTGRLASGDASNGWPNLQQIPAVKELRASFVVDSDEYELVTCDLSGAELTIMCSLADDDALWALSESDDIHSPIATASWRKVYAHRGEKELAENFLITKDINSDLRRKFKNLTFGSVYGCHATKAATTVGVSKQEGQIILDGIKESIPKTFAMVEESTRQAYKNGYLVSDSRSNSRKWFMGVVSGKELEFMEKVAIDGQSRNFRIQSTQASMVKEAIVVIDRFNKKNKLDVKLKGTVHDECIYQYPKGLEVEYNGETIPYAEYVARAMKDTANLYLREPYLMKADYHTAQYWLK